MATAVLGLVLSGCAVGPGTPSQLPAASGPSHETGAPADNKPVSANGEQTRPASPTPARSAAPLPAPTGTQLEQAIATAKLYYAERTRAMNSGDTSRLRALSTPDCPCLDFADDVDRIWKHGSVVAPHYYRVTAEGSTNINADGVTAVINLRYDRGSETYFDSDGKETDTTAGKRGLRSVFLLRKVGDRWKVYDLERYR